MPKTTTQKARKAPILASSDEKLQLKFKRKEQRKLVSASNRRALKALGTPRSELGALLDSRKQQIDFSMSSPQVLLAYGLQEEDNLDFGFSLIDVDVLSYSDIQFETLRLALSLSQPLAEKAVKKARRKAQNALMHAREQCGAVGIQDWGQLGGEVPGAETQASCIGRELDSHHHGTAINLHVKLLERLCMDPAAESRQTPAIDILCGQLAANL